MKKACGLIVITGPMFAGKTTRLLKEVQKASKNRSPILFRSQIDNRYSTSDVVSHDGFRLPAITLQGGEGCIPALKAAASKYDVIAIDEAQFWQGTKGFAETLDRISDSKTVYVATLNKDADGNPFEISKELVSLADRVCSLESKCSKCGGKAGFSQRIINGKEAYGSVTLVGGSDLYEARCRKHFVRPKPA